MKLIVRNLGGAYRAGVPVFADLNFELQGGAIGFVGRNGAGKTCVAETLAGALKAPHGNISLDGFELVAKSSRERVIRGISLVPEGREIFGQLTVRENLLVAAAAAGRGARRLTELEERFPILGTKRHAPGASLSGGEQQLLAIARALIQEPLVVILDEPSLGLSPIAVDRLIVDLKAVLDDSSTSLILMEQNPEILRNLCEEVLLVDRGRFGKIDMSDEREQRDIFQAYLGA